MSVILVSYCHNLNAATSLADTPVLLGSSNIPGNVALALSVEFPTAVGNAYTDSYSTSNTYLGYFDDKKCYQYDPTIALYNTGVDDNGIQLASGTTDPHWTLTSSPANYGNGVMNIVSDDIYLRWGTGTLSSTAKPIGRTFAPENASYTYRTSFFIPPNISASSVVITFRLGHDDKLTSLKVNGTSTGISSNGFSFGDSITLNSSNSTFTSNATNTIDITILNNTGDAGIIVDNLQVSIAGNNIRNTEGGYFIPKVTTSNHTCSGYWSGNFLNWALTQTIDPFRSVLTGGYRSVDKTSTTVLEKAWASGQGGTVVDKAINGIALVQGATPYNWSNIYIRVAGLGNSFAFGNQNNFGAGSNVYSTGSNTNFVDLSTVDTLPNVVPNSDINSGQYLYGMDARVKVCDATTSMGVSGLESNCVAYGSNYKPEGLIQKNALKLNFSAFSFLYQYDASQSGGVMRARMAQLGPNKTVVAANGSTSVSTNPNPEWSASTGVFITNPLPSEASTYGGTGISNSGVINYLNKFGETSRAYMLFDETSELFYAVSRYFRNKGNYAPYTKKPNGAALDQSQYDGFPVITSWDDPIQNKCQKNFIIGIGDTHVSADSDLPGTDDTGVNAIGWTNYIGQAQGYSSYINLGTKTTPWCCSGGTFLMAGLAYNLHTVDQRADLSGSQTVTTYWVDVLESGSPFGEPYNIYDRKDQGETGMRNQFWLTAKYGGFTGTPPTPGNSLAQSQWDTNNDDDPDTYFRANNPALMKAGLTQAFSSIAGSISGSSNAFAVSSPTLQNGSMSYATSYTSLGWTGDVIAKQVSVDQNGLVTTSNPVWNAVSKLEDQASGTGWDSARVIATASTQASGCQTTSNTASSKTATILQNSCGVPFRIANITSAEKSALSSNSNNQQSTLEFLRGDKSNTGLLGTQLYRSRVALLGDIINSKIVPVGPPSQPYIDSFNAGYSNFKSTNVNRPTIVYVGANDGMLHAFDGRAPASSTTAGKELFAYVPNALFQGPSSPATPASDGLAQLANAAYSHHYYVDATPIVADVDYGNKGAIGGVGTVDWHSLLIGGLGKGGKSYFAIDVTDPTNFTKNSNSINEQNLATAVKWEFNHPLMGFTYDTPLVIKTLKYGWVVVLTSGYNNADGKGYIFIVDPKTGALKENPIATGNSTDAGLAHVNAFVADARSGLADALYAADLLGNVWRVDLTGTSGSYSALNIATLTDANGTRQPVTTSPVVEVDTSTGKRYVFIGTGKLLDSTDLSNTQEQTFYAINDGTLSNFYTSTTLPSVAGGFPITRADMVNNTSTILTGITTDNTKPMGYFIDLGTNPISGKTNFINAELASASGVIAFIANSADNTDVCNPSARNLTYQLSYGTGQSVLTDSNGNLISNIGGVGLGVSVSFNQVTYLDANGNKITKLVSIKCDDQGNCTIITPKTSSTKPFTQLNWRELPTAE